MSAVPIQRLDVVDSPHETVTLTGFEKKAWTALAISLPLFGLAEYRIALPLGLDVPIPVVIIGFIAVASTIKMIGRTEARPRAVPVRHMDRKMVLFCYLFFLLQFSAIFRAESFAIGLGEAAKLAIAILAFSTLSAFLPRDRAFMVRFWRIVVVSSTVLFALMVYRHVYVFQAPYLGGSVVAATRAGRNLVTFYLGLIVPIATASAWHARNRLLWVVPLLILLLAWIYSGSRGAWISAVFGLLFAVRGEGRGLGVARVALAIVLGVASIAILWSLVLRNVPTAEAGRRLTYLYSPQAVPELRSYEDRRNRVRETFDLFLDSPIWGAGIRGQLPEETLSSTTHNDYVSILGQFGIIGLVLFGGILVRFTQLSWPRERRAGDGTLRFAVRGATVGLLVALLGISVYTSTLFWVYMALLIVTRQAADAPGPRAVA